MKLYYLSNIDLKEAEVLSDKKDVFACFKSIEELFRLSHISGDNVMLYEVKNLDLFPTEKEGVKEKYIVSKKIKISNRLNYETLKSNLFWDRCLDKSLFYRIILSLDNITEEQIFLFYAAQIRHSYFLKELLTDERISKPLKKRIIKDQLWYLNLQIDNCYSIVSDILKLDTLDEEDFELIVKKVIDLKLDISLIIEYPKSNEEVIDRVINCSKDIKNLAKIIKDPDLDLNIYKKIVKKIIKLIPDYYHSSRIYAYDLMIDIIYNPASDVNTLKEIVDILPIFDKEMVDCLIEEIIKNKNFDQKILTDIKTISLKPKHLSYFLLGLDIIKDSLEEFVLNNIEYTVIKNASQNPTFKEVIIDLYSKIKTTGNLDLFEKLMAIENILLKLSIESQSEESEIQKLDFRKEKIKQLNIYLTEFKFCLILSRVIKEMVSEGILTKEEVIDKKYIKECKREIKYCDILSYGLTNVEEKPKAKKELPKRLVKVVFE